MHSVTYPSHTSDEGPTARILSRYVDVVRVSLWVVLLETDGRPLVEVVNSPLDHVSLSTICAGNRSASVCDRIWSTSSILNVPLISLGNTMPAQKVPGLSSEGSLRRHCAAQGRIVKHRFYLGALRRRRNAVRSNGQEMAVCLLPSHNRSRPLP